MTAISQPQISFRNKGLRSSRLNCSELAKIYLQNQIFPTVTVGTKYLKKMVWPSLFRLKHLFSWTL